MWNLMRQSGIIRNFIFLCKTSSKCSLSSRRLVKRQSVKSYTDFVVIVVVTIVCISSKRSFECEKGSTDL